MIVAENCIALAALCSHPSDDAVVRVVPIRGCRPANSNQIRDHSGPEGCLFTSGISGEARSTRRVTSYCEKSWTLADIGVSPLH